MRSLTCQCCGAVPLRAIARSDRFVCETCRTVHALAPAPIEWRHVGRLLPPGAAREWPEGGAVRIDPAWPGVVIVCEYLVPA